MKFVGHCFLVLLLFSSNFKGIISTLEEMNILEATILNLDNI